MTPFRLRYTPVAADSIRRLHPTAKGAVREAVRRLVEDPFLGHALILELTGYRSLRVSRYRIIYCIQEDFRTVDVHFVGPRKTVYEAFRTLLAQSLPGRP